MPAQSGDHEVRIIGGNWRSRKVSFANHEEIRPTPSRIRETLFNWLQFSVTGARCLELYGGSGILSLEALSRGAGHVTVVEQSSLVSQYQRQVFNNLSQKPDSFSCINMSAIEFIRHSATAASTNSQYDLIFLDPPFTGTELADIVPMIDHYHLLAEGGYVYIESGQKLEQTDLPPNWVFYRQKKAGAVNYCLCQIEV